MKRKVISLIMALTLLLSLQPVYGANQPVTLDMFQDVLKKVEAGYYKPVSRDALLQASLKGMLESLDPYSEYFTASDYKSFTDSIEGTFVGIGIIVNEHPQYIEVAQVYPGSPALGAGIQKNDLITSVNGQDISVMNFKDRIDRLLGAENTAVTIGISRGSEKLTKTLVRKKIEVNPVESKVLDNQLGYIRIYEFTTTSGKYFEDALAALQNQKIQGLILDLRDNPGGDIQAVLEISEKLVPKGTTLITIKYRDGQDSYLSEGAPLGLPMAVLINENSASGSEMLAGIIKDNKAGTLIGTKSYGKGVAQSTYDLQGGAAGGFKMTIAEFFTTALIKIQGVGINPNVVIEQPNVLNKEMLKNIAIIGNDPPIKVGHSGLNIMAVEQRLRVLGYSLVADGLYDPPLFETLKQMGIDADGSLTQAEAQKVQNLVDEASKKSEEDVQLKKAIEIVTSRLK